MIAQSVILLYEVAKQASVQLTPLVRSVDESVLNK